MGIYSENKHYKLYQGKMQNELKTLDNNSIDSIVTDPPYELGFMNKSWDSSGVAFQKETWEECLRVLKPGGYLLAFGGSRTFHRIACAIEDAGFEIRDTIMWIYGSGFPKSMNIGLAIDKKNGVENRTGNIVKGRGSKECGVRIFSDDNYEWKSEVEEREAQNEWKGWGTQLKPSYEPIIVARKPVENSIIDNVSKYGVGGINVDECRIPLEEDYTYRITNREAMGEDGIFCNKNCGFDSVNKTCASASPNGRFPANTILTYDDSDYEEVCGGFPNSKGASSQNNYSSGHIYRGQSLQESDTSLEGYREWYNDDGSASRYFYCAKASKRDRDEGLEEMEEKETNTFLYEGDENSMFSSRNTTKHNIHPTVKPTSLMGYLIRLVTPKGGVVLDPFMGSGSTGKATMYENNDRDANYKFIGVEMTEEYLPICKARIDFACKDKEQIVYEKSDIVPREITLKKDEYNRYDLFDLI